MRWATSGQSSAGSTPARATSACWTCRLARVGARQRRPLRWRLRQRHDLRRVRRWLEGLHPSGDAVARGLFHRAIVESGARHAAVEPQAAGQTTELLLGKLGVSTVEELCAVPIDRLLAAQVDVLGGVLGGTFGSGQRLEPVLDGTSQPVHPFEPVAAPSAAGVSLLIGTTRDEMTLFLGAALRDLDDIEARSRAGATFPGGEGLVRRLPQNAGPATPGELMVGLSPPVVLGRARSVWPSARAPPRRSGCTGSTSRLPCSVGPWDHRTVSSCRSSSTTFTPRGSMAIGPRRRRWQPACASRRRLCLRQERRSEPPRSAGVASLRRRSPSDDALRRRLLRRGRSRRVRSAWPGRHWPSAPSTQAGIRAEIARSDAWVRARGSAARGRGGSGAPRRRPPGRSARSTPRWARPW